MTIESELSVVVMVVKRVVSVTVVDVSCSVLMSVVLLVGAVEVMDVVEAVTPTQEHAELIWAELYLLWLKQAGGVAEVSARFGGGGACVIV